MSRADTGATDKKFTSSGSVTHSKAAGKMEKTGGSAFAPHTIVGAVEPEWQPGGTLRPPNPRQ